MVGLVMGVKPSVLARSRQTLFGRFRFILLFAGFLGYFSHDSLTVSLGDTSPAGFTAQAGELFQGHHRPASLLASSEKASCDP